MTVATRRPERAAFRRPPADCRCDCGRCNGKVEPGWNLCRPCAIGTHAGQPCPVHEPLPFPKYQPECAACGWHRDDHDSV